MRFLLLVFALCLSVFACTANAEADFKDLRAKVAKSFPGVTIKAIRQTPITGVYEIEIGARVFYVSGDGKFLLIGDMVDLDKRKNLTEQRRQKIALNLLNQVGEDNMIVIGPKHPKRTITVFTDVDCPYCQRLHRDVPKLNEDGVRVRYLFFPRAGLQSRTYQKSVAVWCAKDRVKAIGIAKSGGGLEMKTCPNPVAEHYHLAEQLDVDGTPTIYLDDGRRIGGYVPPDRLLALLGLKHVSHATR